jgi:hypothetical protein
MTSPALPLPYESPPLVEVDFDAFFLAVEHRITNSRIRCRQPPLVPDGRILVGQETLSKQISSPSIRVVPIDVRFTESDFIPDNIEPRTLYSQWLRLEAHCWGYDSDDPSKPLWGFSSSLELARQFIVALCDSNLGPANVRVLGGEWVQRTDINRQGRVLVVTVEIETWLTRDPAVQLPAATSTTPGVQATVGVSIENPITGTPTSGASFVVPP